MAISFKGAKKYKKHNGFSAGGTIKTPLPSPVHFYALKQGIVHLEPMTGIDSRVLAGQKIADAPEFEINPVISSVSGRVTAITNDYIAIENDMMFLSALFLPPAAGAASLTSREILWLLREGGVYEPRYNKPLHVLLSDKRVSDCIIVCCFDSDPYVSSPQTATDGNCQKILRALETAMRVSGITKAYIAVEDDTRHTFADFKAALRFNASATPFIMKARYPQSRRDMLIKTVTGSVSTNAMILSAETLCNMADVLETGAPVTSKIVTLSGDDILEPENFRVPLGATVASVIESGGYFSAEAVISGGVIDGEPLVDLDTPVTNATTAFAVFHEKKNIPKYRKKLL